MTSPAPRRRAGASWTATAREERRADDVAVAVLRGFAAPAFAGAFFGSDAPSPVERAGAGRAGRGPRRRRGRGAARGPPPPPSPPPPPPAPPRGGAGGPPAAGPGR